MWKAICSRWLKKLECSNSSKYDKIQCKLKRFCECLSDLQDPWLQHFMYIKQRAAYSPWSELWCDGSTNTNSRTGVWHPAGSESHLSLLCRQFSTRMSIVNTKRETKFSSQSVLRMGSSGQCAFNISYELQRTNSPSQLCFFPPHCKMLNYS